MILITQSQIYYEVLLYKAIAVNTKYILCCCTIGRHVGHHGEITNFSVGTTKRYIITTMGSTKSTFIMFHTQPIITSL